jgi:hypothetical protein
LESRQFDFLKESCDKASGQGKKVTLMTHFTFASFNENIPSENANREDSDKNGKATIDISTTSYTSSLYDFGTFEDKRKKTYRLIRDNKISCIITGHSHRSGLYSFSDFGFSSVKASFNDLEGNIPGVPVIVSDCGGPIPRCNKYGEFHGYGSSRTSGTIIEFNLLNGSVSSIKKVEVGDKPRFVTAMDYVSLIHNPSWWNPANTVPGRIYGIAVATIDPDVDAFRKFETASLSDYTFEIEIDNRITSEPGADVNDIDIDGVIIYSKLGDGWKKIQLVPEGRTGRVFRYSVDSGERGDFRDILRDADAKVFLSIKFNSRSRKYSQYNFNDWWNFECLLEKDDDKYIMDRQTGYDEPAEVPDFERDRKASVYGVKYPT